MGETLQDTALDLKPHGGERQLLFGLALSVDLQPGERNRDFLVEFGPWIYPG